MNLSASRNLPIWEVEQAILDALQEYPVVVVSSPTGSGKSTQIPQLLLEAGYASTGMIGVTQPRRVAAASVARRIAFEQGVQCGREVGFQVRFTEELSPLTRIKVATEGIFLQEARFDSLFSRYVVLMLDEVHELTIEMYLLLGLAKLAIAQREDLRLVVSSATVNIPALERFFGGQAKVIESDGRQFSVEHRFEEQEPVLTERNTFFSQRYGMAEFAADKVIEIIEAGERGDILVFLAGFEDLERARERFSESHPEVKALLAYGEMPLEDLEALMNPNGCQRVIFSTNVAETSVTPVGVTVVINSGQVKKDFCSAQTGITSLLLIDTSRSSDLQRAGRAGRVAPGVCYHLFTRDRYEKHQEFDTPAIQRTHLGQALLTLAVIGVKDFYHFPLLDRPDYRQVELARQSLVEIGALDDENNLTDYGRQIARFPLAPELAHFMIQAANDDAVAEMATFLAIQEARPIPKPRKDRIGTPGYMSLVASCQSDPEVYLKLWEGYYEAGFDWDWAKGIGLNPRRMHEAREVRGQLLKIASEQGLPISSAETDFARLKRALVRSQPKHIAIIESLGMGHTYRSLIGELDEIYVHPSSRLFYGAPHLLWYFQAQKTSKLFAQSCMALKIEELKSIFPGKVTVEKKEEFHPFLGKVYVYDRIFFDGVFIGEGEFEVREMTAAEQMAYELRSYSPGQPFGQPITPEAIAAAEMQLMQIEATKRRYEAEQAERRHEARVLLAEMPALPADAPECLQNHLANILSALNDQDVGDGMLAWIKDSLVRFREDVQAHLDQQVEREAKIRTCKEERDLYVAVYLDKCPICASAVIDKIGVCECVTFIAKETLCLNGSRETDLIRIVDDSDNLIARIFIDNPKGALRKIWREVREVTAPFEELKVITRE